MSIRKCDACGGPGGIWPVGVGDDYLCGRCIMAQARADLAAAIEDLPTLPEMPVFQPSTVRALDELEGCDVLPSPDTYCAACYLTHLENHAAEWVPSSDPVLCPAHEARMVSELLRQHPGLLAAPQGTRKLAYTKQRNLVRAVAMRQAERAQEKLSQGH